MPEYDFLHPETKQVITVIQNMNEDHVLEVNGVKCERIFSIPNAAIDTNINPFSQKEFVEKSDKKGTLGDLIDRSKELSIKREEKIGAPDPVKEKYYQSYAEKRNGAQHPDIISRNAVAKLKKMGVTVE